MANTGTTYVTIDAVLAPTSRMLRMLITKARPVPIAPSATTEPTTGHGKAVALRQPAAQQRRRDGQHRGRDQQLTGRHHRARLRAAGR